MMYTADEKQRMDRILAGFQAYIRESPEIDILYSEKVGYILIPVEDPEGEVIVTISSVDKLLHLLYSEIISDVRYEDSRKQHYNNELDEDEKRESRRRITEIVMTLGEEKAYCMNFLDTYLEEYPHNMIYD